VFRFSRFRLLTLHYAFYQLSVAMAAGFVGAYLLQLGFSLSEALVAYAALLTIRCALRFVGLGVVRRLGYRGAIVSGAILGATQFIPLLYADQVVWLVVWLTAVALSEALYWPVYHAAVAVTGVGGARGRELGIRTAVGALVGVLGPLAGGVLLQHFGPAFDFAIAAALMAVSAVPLVAMGEIPAGAVPRARESMRGMDGAAMMAFAADGWMASGLALAWPMALFVSLGSHYESFGLANAAAGLAGAVTGLLGGRAIDRGGRQRSLVIVCWALALGFALRASATWSPVAATIANATGAAVMGVYVPVLMSVIYDRAQQSGAAYRFHFAAEAGWDAGAASGCLIAAALVWATAAPSLAVVPGALGVFVLYLSVRAPKAVIPGPVNVREPASAAS
jgi:MFS family permease